MHIALLTGRGGSSLKDKNVKVINGRPLCAYSCAAANLSHVFDKTYCSSDSAKILDVASAYGFRGIERPDHLALSTALHVDVIEHFLEICTNKSMQLSSLTVLMANSATITADQLRTSHQLLLSDDTITSVVPVVKEQDLHPWRARKLVDGKLTPYFEFDKPISSNRQELPDNYFLTHSFWMIKIKDNKLSPSLKSAPWDFLGNNCLPLEVDSSIDVHSEDDYLRTSAWLEASNVDCF